MAFERQRCGKEEEFAQQEADKALAEIDAKLNKRAKDVRKLLKEASKELVAREKYFQIEAGPSPWDDEAAQEVPVFTEPLPPIHVPPNQKPGWCSRRVAPEDAVVAPAGERGEDGRAADDPCRAVDAALAAEPHARGEGVAGYQC